MGLGVRVRVHRVDRRLQVHLRRPVRDERARGRGRGRVRDRVRVRVRVRAPGRLRLH